MPSLGMRTIGWQEVAGTALWPGWPCALRGQHTHLDCGVEAGGHQAHLWHPLALGDPVRVLPVEIQVILCV